MRVLFLGEDALHDAARYLGAILKWSKIKFDYRPDRARLPKAWRMRHYDAILLSDYRYASWTPCAQEWLIQTTRNGTGLFMMGGWASFTGQVGGYAGTAIERLLPVRCMPGDDRVNRPAILKVSSKSVVVNGYHKVRLKPESQTILNFYDLGFTEGKPVLGASHPALVTGHEGKGRTAAFMTDCAPHWAGGLVDWGSKRIQVSGERIGVVEAGEDYFKFFKKWIYWVGQRI